MEFAPPAPTTILAPHPSASIVPIVDAHIPALRRINTLLLPVNYQESFYHGILDPAVSGTFSRAILWHDDPAGDAPLKVIGGVVCRLERSPFDDGGRYSRELAKKAHHAVAPPPVGQGYALYIQSLGLLSPYRRYGLAAAAVQGILDAATRPGGQQLRIDWVYAHVWTENEDGLAWYTARAFQKDSVLDDYYFKLKPGSAWVVKKRLVPAASSPGGTAAAAAQGSKENRALAPTSSESPNNAAAPPASVTAAAVNLPAFATESPPPPPPSTTNNGPPKKPTTTTTTNRPPLPPPTSSSLSFQNKRPDMEWNDMPEDMLLAPSSSSKNSSRSNLLAPPSNTTTNAATTGAGGASASSSRSSSAQRKKKERAYPTAAFGS